MKFIYIVITAFFSPRCGWSVSVLSVLAIAFRVVVIDTSPLAPQSESISRTAFKRRVPTGVDNLIFRTVILVLKEMQCYVQLHFYIFNITPRSSAAGLGYTVPASRPVHGANPMISSNFIYEYNIIKYAGICISSQKCTIYNDNDGMLFCCFVLTVLAVFLLFAIAL